jgi:hypothetical protein
MGVSAFQRRLTAEPYLDRSSSAISHPGYAEDSPVFAGINLRGDLAELICNRLSGLEREGDDAHSEIMPRIQPAHFRGEISVLGATDNASPFPTPGFPLATGACFQ